MIRLAGAPISWGVCEVPGWGKILPVERVLAEMKSLGLHAVELGAPGFFPDDPKELRALLANYGMHVIGGFVPMIVHDPAQADATIAEAHAVAARFAACGAELFITAAVVDAGWAPRFELDDAQWAHVATMLGRLDEVVAEHGLTQVLHPHVGTLVETKTDVRQVLDRSDVKWCLDTGHLAIGGTDVVAFTGEVHDRVGLVHLKDVSMPLAARYNAGELTLMGAVQEGLFCNLGTGDVPVAEVISLLETAGYQGWYTLEQDQAITGPEPEYGTGPIDDVRESVAYLRTRFDVNAAA